MGLFLTIVLSVWALMHAYVFARLGSIPWLGLHQSPWKLWLIALGCWAFYPLVRTVDAFKPGFVPWLIEGFAAQWIGILFLAFAGFLILDLVTLGGALWRAYTVTLRGALVGVVAVLSLVASIQGFRAPVVREYEVALPGLPRERDGLVLVHVSDLHLGAVLRGSWMRRLAGRVAELRPDLVVVVGDVIDGDAPRVEPMLPELSRLQAPLGVWAVTGNHEYYAGVDASVRILERAGFNVLRNRSAEVVPGLVLAGVDDLSARRQFHASGDALGRALSPRPAGATILLSHTPLRVEESARLGVGLMLSGHTHNGQIWPFTHLVRLRYPHICGRYEVDGMTLLVSRGAGTWGPRMRLWRPGEVLKITLRSGPG